MLFQRPNNEFDQAAEFKELGFQPTATAAWDLSEPPAQMHPKIKQHEAQANQQKSVRWVRRSRPTADLAGATVARLDSEATPVLSARLPWRPIQFDQDEDHPIDFALMAAGAFGGGEHAANRQFGHEGRLAGTVKRIVSALATRPLAQGPCATALAANGAGDQGRLLAACQILHDGDPVEPTIQNSRAMLIPCVLPVSAGHPAR